MKSWPKIEDGLADYVDANWLREGPIKRRLREETARMRGAGMQISVHQGEQIALLARMIGARRAVEVGTFTGYSSLWIAEALPPDGKLSRAQNLIAAGAIIGLLATTRYFDVLALLPALLFWWVTQRPAPRMGPLSFSCMAGPRTFTASSMSPPCSQELASG